MGRPKLRPETSSSVEMGDSRWDERCLNYRGSLVCSSWGIQRLAHFKFLWCVFSRWVNMLSLLSPWGHLYGFYRLMNA